MAIPLPTRLARELPSLWRADELARPVGAVVPSGHAALDAQLPAGGWPVGSLVEVLQAQTHQGSQHVNSHCEWRLLLPALVQGRGPVLLVGAPHSPFGPGLAAQGLDPQRLLWVVAQAPAQRLWATEQALRCADVCAVLAWLPQVRAEQLRRLHIAASNHAKLLFVMRPQAARQESSPAVLRVLVRGQDALELHILKRRGPPLAQPLSLPARTARLAALLAVTRRHVVVVQADDVGAPQTLAQVSPFPGLNVNPNASLNANANFNPDADLSPKARHALDRTAAVA
jgi:protein ImuA